MTLTPDVDLSNYGYYKGVLSGFNNIQDAEQIIKYLKLTGVDSKTNTNTYESDQYKELYEQFKDITFHILLFIRDEKVAAKSNTQLYTIASSLKKPPSGGKNGRTLKIRKISDSRCKRKSNRCVRKLARLRRTHRKRIRRRAMASNRKVRRLSGK